jgi:hypothetical protein
MSYTRAELEQRVNAGIKNKLGLLTDKAQTINDAVRAVANEVDLRSCRRKSSVSPGIFDEVLAYPAPPDLKAQKLVSLSEQANGGDVYVGFSLIPYEQFNQRLGFVSRTDSGNPTEIRFGNQRELYTVAFDDLSGVRRILISAPQTGSSQVVSSLDSLNSGGGLWTSFGDAVNVDADSGNVIRGVASLGFDINANGGPTAGIYNATLDPIDVSGFLKSNDSVFVFAYVTDETEITNFTLRFGVSAASYYQIVVTSTHFNTTFQRGWNVLRFDASNITTVNGPINNTAITYAALFMTKEATKISQKGFNFDHIVLRTGSKMNLRYYSKYPWRSQAGVWKENSDADDDILNVESDEFELMIQKGIVHAGMEADEMGAVNAAQIAYDRKLSVYSRGNPSESLVETVDYQSQYYI